MQKKSRKQRAQKSLKDGQTLTKGIRKGGHGEKRKTSGFIGVHVLKTRGTSGC
jgi:hypothetical protein